jgi:PAS domain S-box-containing protein
VKTADDGDRSPEAKGKSSEARIADLTEINYQLTTELERRIRAEAELRVANEQLTGRIDEHLQIEKELQQRERELRISEEDLRTRLWRFALLAQTAAKLLRSRDSRRDVERLGREVMAQLDCHIFLYFLTDPDTDRLCLNAFAGISEADAQALEWLDLNAEIREGIAAHIDTRALADFTRGIEEQIKGLKSLLARALVCYPLVGSEGRILGMLCFGTRTRDAFHVDELALMKAVADQVAVAISRIQVEEALRISEERLSAGLEATQIGLWDWDISQSRTHFSPTWYTMLGYEPDELPATPETWTNLIHPEDRQRALEMIQAMWLREKDTFECEFRMRAKSGDYRWILSRGKVVLWSAADLPVRMIGTHNDITARKRMELELKESEERSRQLAEASFEGIVLHRNGEILEINRRLAEIVGRHPEQIVGLSIFQFIVPEQHGLVSKHFSDESRQPYELTLLHSSGRRIPVDVLSRAIQWQGMEVRVAAVRDATDRRQTEAMLRQRAALLDQANDAIVVRDLDDRIIFWNQGAERTYGWTREEALQKVAHVLLKTRYPMPFEEVRKRILQDEAYACELDQTCKDGRRIVVESRWALQRDDEGRAIAILQINRDITIRKQLEDQIRQHNLELEAEINRRTAQIQILERQRLENEKQAALGRMASRIAHEINNPLAGVKNSFLIVKKAIPADFKHYDFVGRIDREIDRMARIVRQMFELYKPASDPARALQIREVLTDITLLLEGNAHSQGVDFTISTPVDMDAVVVHEDSLRQILYSIIQNAIEASPQGGNIRIEASVKEKDLCISVIDQGCGIAPELQMKIFDPFFTTKSGLSTGGLGLGLSITKGLVEALRGSIQFSSNAGQGTTFYLTIPLHMNTPEE